MEKQELSALHHCIFSLQYHLVLVTRYRRKVITSAMQQRLTEIFEATLEKWNCRIIECNGAEDHTHLLFATTPNLQLSGLVNNLKTVSSRLIRKEFPREVNKVYWQPVFWQRSYCLISAGGAPLEILKRYIQEQGAE